MIVRVRNGSDDLPPGTEIRVDLERVAMIAKIGHAFFVYAGGSSSERVEVQPYDAAYPAVAARFEAMGG